MPHPTKGHQTQAPRPNETPDEPDVGDTHETPAGAHESQPSGAPNSDRHATEIAGSKPRADD